MLVSNKIQRHAVTKELKRLYMISTTDKSGHAKYEHRKCFFRWGDLGPT